MRLIDADALIFTHEIARSLDDGHTWNELCITADEIAEAPTIEPKRGKWKAKSFHECFCDNCGFSFDVMKCDFLENMKFCPNCGADMRKERE